MSLKSTLVLRRWPEAAYRSLFALGVLLGCSLWPGQAEAELSSAPPAAPSQVGIFAEEAPGFRPQFTVEGELFTGFTAIPKRSFSEFELNRAELGLRAQPHEQLGFELRLEAIRSASADSLLGVDGNSILTRVKRGYGFGQTELGPVHFELRAGLIPDAWVERLERYYEFRGLSPMLAEAGQFFDSSDLGASLTLRSPADWLGGDALSLSLSATNGEGSREVEQNSGKNLTIVASFQPELAQLFGEPLRAGVQGALRDGSQGVGSQRNHRAALAAGVYHSYFQVGFESAWAEGYQGDGAVSASGFGGWFGVNLVPEWVGVTGRYGLVKQDLAQDEVDRGEWIAAVFTDLGRRAARDAEIFGGLRVYAGMQRLFGDRNAGPVVGTPEAADETRLLVWVSALAGSNIRKE